MSAAAGLLTYERIKTLAAQVHMGSAIGSTDARALLSFIRRLQDRITTSESLLAWLHESGFCALFNEVGHWEIGRPGETPLAVHASLHAAIARARHRWECFEAQLEREILFEQLRAVNARLQ